MEWRDDSTAVVTWGGAVAHRPSHKIKYSKEGGVQNAVTVGSGGSATLRGLEPGSTYRVQVLRLEGEGGVDGMTPVAETTLQTKKVAGAREEWSVLAWIGVGRRWTLLPGGGGRGGGGGSV